MSLPSLFHFPCPLSPAPLSPTFHTLNKTNTHPSYTNAIAWANLAPHDWTFCLFYTIWDFLELCFVYFFYIETRGPTLEELAKIFDGDSAEVAHLDMREVEKDIHLDNEPIHEKQAVQANESTV